MSKNPLVSVLMTSYNREKYINEAIESVLNSTFTDFELIIVDDCSKDRTVEIARKYEKQDSRIKVFVNDSNLGDYPNRNKAASHASGKYLKYVDADDYIYPNGLGIIVSQMEAHPNAGVGLFSLPQNIHKPFPIELKPIEAYKYHYFGPGLFHKAPLSSIIRRECFEKVGGFKPERMTSDFEMWHRMAQQYNFLLIQDHIVWYREHDSQEINSKAKFELSYQRIEKAFIEDLDSPLTELERKKIKRNRTRALLKQSIRSALKIKFSNSISQFQKYLILKGWIK